MWTVKHPHFALPSCSVGGLRGEEQTIWIPANLECRRSMRCLFHEFYELWLIRVGGFKKSVGGADPADDLARRLSLRIPMAKCCTECE